MNRPTKTRTSLEERLERGDSYWILSERRFGGEMIDINDFEGDNYAHFLDNVPSRNELIRGLSELSPLADDALSIAEGLAEQEFHGFKRTLAKERDGESTNMSKKFMTLVVPKRFLLAAIVSDEFQTPLGAALIRLMEMEGKEKG